MLAIDFVSVDFKTIQSPLNPHQFNYKDYLARQGICQQVYLKKNTYKFFGKGSTTLVGFAASIRNKIQRSLQKHSFSKNTLGVLNALLLGQRQDLSRELLTDYANAGAIHILAVSGLHVGIILLLLNFLLKPIRSIQNGNFIKLILIVGFLWCFAFIAGLSASVVRAVTVYFCIHWSIV
jgi:competence protein ComEC